MVVDHSSQLCVLLLTTRYKLVLLLTTRYCYVKFGAVPSSSSVRLLVVASFLAVVGACCHVQG